jgi:hypothetical protein
MIGGLWALAALFEVLRTSFSAVCLRGSSGSAVCRTDLGNLSLSSGSIMTLSFVRAPSFAL